MGAVIGVVAGYRIYLTRPKGVKAKFSLKEAD